jgi:hypothetical protein
MSSHRWDGSPVGRVPLGPWRDGEEGQLGGDAHQVHGVQIEEHGLCPPEHRCRVVAPLVSRAKCEQRPVGDLDVAEHDGSPVGGNRCQVTADDRAVV